VSQCTILFRNSDFFDPDDLVQVKYEMLRQVHIDNGSISESAPTFGFSRPSFYQAQAAFQQDGVFGLFPHKRGPQGGHTLTSEVMEFVAQQHLPILQLPTTCPTIKTVPDSGASAEHSAAFAAAKKRR
jgi:hypothetical protein